MDIEHLNKTQILLLTLLVSFVTSIATGIVTVSLMGQAPQGVTQTVNRIVERTVEKVVTQPIRSTAAAITGVAPVPAPVASETTVVVKEDDLAADSIARVQNSMVRLVERGGNEDGAFARGVIVDKSGVVVADRATTDPNLGTDVILSTGERFRAEPRPALLGEVLRYYDLNTTGTTTPALSAIPLADHSHLRLGQSVIRIGGRTRDSVAEGVISILPTSGQVT
jgi:S1-C subfamily serine protease